MLLKVGKQWFNTANIIKFNYNYSVNVIWLISHYLSRKKQFNLISVNLDMESSDRISIPTFEQLFT